MQSPTSNLSQAISKPRQHYGLAEWNHEYNAWLRGAQTYELKAAAIARRFIGWKRTRICGSAHRQRQELQLPEVLS